MQKHLLHICLVFKKAGVQFLIHIVEFNGNISIGFTGKLFRPVCISVIKELRKLEL